jgi:hypothetical protein
MTCGGMGIVSWHGNGAAVPPAGTVMAAKAGTAHAANSGCRSLPGSELCRQDAMKFVVAAAPGF